MIRRSRRNRVAANFSKVFSQPGFTEQCRYLGSQSIARNIFLFQGISKDVSGFLLHALALSFGAFLQANLELGSQIASEELRHPVCQLRYHDITLAQGPVYRLTSSASVTNCRNAFLHDGHCGRNPRGPKTGYPETWSSCARNGPRRQAGVRDSDFASM
jgi:hypothetical protein